MNFIIRNLGWILLIIFFVFMLYLISNQNNVKDVNSLSSTWVTLEQSDLVEEINPEIEISEPLIEIKKDVPTISLEWESTTIKTDVDSLITKIDVNSDDVTVETGDVNIDEITNNTEAEVISSTGGMMSSIRDFFTIKKVETSTWVKLSETLWVDKDLIAEVESEISATSDLDENENEEGNITVEINDGEVLVLSDKESDDNNEIEEVIDEKEITEVVVEKEKKKGLFDFSFWKKEIEETVWNLDINKDVVLDVTNENTPKEDDVVIVKLSDEELDKIESEKLESEKIEVTKLESEKAETKKTQSTNKEENNSDNVVVNNVKASAGAIATYEVWVKSMFLNNAWFTKRTGVLYKGDTVEQLTETNQYGCFKVRVLSSIQEWNNGKEAWACEYYMVGHQGSLDSYKNAANKYYRNMNKNTHRTVAKKSTKKVLTTKAVTKAKPVKKDAQVSSDESSVWTMHSVAVNSLKLNNESFTQAQAYLLKGDKLEQITNTDESGCFKVSVYSSSNTLSSAKGKTGWVCQKYLK